MLLKFKLFMVCSGSRPRKIDTVYLLLGYVKSRIENSKNFFEIAALLYRRKQSGIVQNMYVILNVANNLDFLIRKIKRLGL